MTRALLQQALDALQHIPTSFGNMAYTKEVVDAIAALQAALGAPEPEPVAWIGDSPTKGNGRRLFWTYAGAHAYASKIESLYTRPAVPLNDAGLLAILKSVDPETRRLPPGFKDFARAVEAAHGIKPISECSDGEIYSRLSARDHKPDWSAA